MSRKRKHDASKSDPLDAATDVEGKAAAAAAFDAGAAGAGPAGGDEPAPPPDEAGADPAQPADGADGGAVPGAADGAAHEGDGADAEAAATEEPVEEGGEDDQVQARDPEGEADVDAAASRQRDPGDEEPEHGAPDPDQADEKTGAEAGADPERGEPPRNRMDVNVLAAMAAAGMAYGTHEEDATTLPRLDLGWLSDPDTPADRRIAAAECAGAFLRKARQPAPPAAETMVIHLRRAGHACPLAAGRERVAWSVFAHALAELDQLDAAAVRAAEEAARAQTGPQGPRAVPREALTYAPPDGNPLSQIGRRHMQKTVRKREKR
jgi:hypothetical protein